MRRVVGGREDGGRWRRWWGVEKVVGMGGLGVWMFGGSGGLGGLGVWRVSEWVGKKFKKKCLRGV